MYICKKCGWAGEVLGQQRCLPCAAKRTAEWRKNNPEKFKAQRARYDKRFRELRPEQYRQKKRKYYLPATAKKARERRIAWLKEGDVTMAQLKHIFEMWKGLCAYCQKPVKPRFTPFDPRGFDHVKSRVNGGKHTKDNIVVCCRQCNELKG